MSDKIVVRVVSVEASTAVRAFQNLESNTSTQSGFPDHVDAAGNILDVSGEPMLDLPSFMEQEYINSLRRSKSNG